MITKISIWKINETINNNILYHGSKNKFNKFTIDKEINNPTYNLNNLDHGLGIFLTDNLTMAKWFAGIIDFNPNSGKYENTNETGYVYNVKVNINNSYIINEHHEVDIDDSGQTYFDVIEKYGGGKKFREYLLKNEYDSVIVKNATTNYYEDGQYDIIVILEPKNIQIIN